MSGPRDAATVLLLRPAEPFEIFMVQRGKTAPFMPRAMVFPGGRVDDADEALLACSDLDPDDAARRLGHPDPVRAHAFFVAAARETFEEAGVLLAAGDLDLRRLDAHRDALNARQRSFAQIIEAESLHLRLHDLALHAHWITPPIEKRRFDTRFFMARFPDGQTPLHDAQETVASAWYTPRAALDAYAAGDLRLAPPTLRVLLDLSTCADIDTALAYQVGVPPPIQPQHQFVDGELHLLLPGDAEFDPPGEARNRVIMRRGRWVSERS